MSELKNDDLLLVNRGGVDYKITMQDLADYLQVEPVPEPPAELPWEKYIGHKPVYHITNISSAVKFQNAEGVWLESGEEYTGGGDLPDGLGDYYIMGRLVKFQSSTGKWDFGSDTDTTGLDDCSEMFKGSKKFNGAFGGNWDMSAVTTMESMFEDATDMDRPEVGTWDVHNVTNFKRFLANNRNGYPVFNQDLSNWCVPNFTREPQQFWGEKLIGVNRPGWGKCPNGECGTVIPNDYDWKSTVKVHITDVINNSQDPPPVGGSFHWLSSEHFPYNHFREDGSYANINYNFGKGGTDFYCSWDDRQGRLVNLGRHHILSWNFGPDTDTTGLTNLDSLLENAKYWKGNFGGTWDLSKVTSMKKTFKDVGIDIGNGGIYSWPLGHPIQGINGFDVSNVEDFEECFRNTNHDIDVSNWDTTSAKNMTNMFFQEDGTPRPGPKESLRGWCVKHISSEPAGWAWMYERDQPAWGYCPAEGNNPPDLTGGAIYECFFTNTPVGTWVDGGLGTFTVKDASGKEYTQADFEPSDSFGDPERIFSQEAWNKDDADVWKVEVKTATAPPILEWIPRATLAGNKLEFAYFAWGNVPFEVVINGESKGQFEFNKDNVELLEFSIPDGKFKSLEIKNTKVGEGNYGERGYRMSIGNIFIDDHNVQTPRQDGQVHLFFDKEAQDEIEELVASPKFKGGSQVMGADHGDHHFDIMTADAKNLTVVLNHSDRYNEWRKPSDWWFVKD